jgi:hypothetical protein
MAGKWSTVLRMATELCDADDGDDDADDDVHDDDDDGDDDDADDGDDDDADDGDDDVHDDDDDDDVMLMMAMASRTRF